MIQEIQRLLAAHARADRITFARESIHNEGTRIDIVVDDQNSPARSIQIPLLMEFSTLRLATLNATVCRPAIAGPTSSNSLHPDAIIEAMALLVNVTSKLRAGLSRNREERMLRRHGISLQPKIKTDFKHF